MLTLVVVQAFGAAAVGRFQSTTLAFVGGVGIGVVQSLLNAPRIRDVVPFVDDLPGLDQAVPFIVLFAVLLATRADRLHERATRERLGRASPTRGRCWRASWCVGIGTAIVLPFAFESRLPVYTLGAVFVIVFASLLPAHRGVEPGLPVPGRRSSPSARPPSATSPRASDCPGPQA